MTIRATRPFAAFSLLLALSIPAGMAAQAAVSLVNRDAKDHKLTVIEDGGGKTTDHMLKPNQLLEGFCDKGCVIRLNDNEQDEYELVAGDKVSIEEGFLYYDEPESPQQGAGPAPAPGGLPPARDDAPKAAPKQ